MSFVGVTRNLGGRSASARWIADLVADRHGAPDIIALQELPHAGASLQGYQTFPKTASVRESSNARRSAVLVRDGIECRPVTDDRLLSLLGTYVVTVGVNLRGS